MFEQIISSFNDNKILSKGQQFRQNIEKTYTWNFSDEKVLPSKFRKFHLNSPSNFGNHYRNYNPIEINRQYFPSKIEMKTHQFNEMPQWSQKPKYKPSSKQIVCRTNYMLCI
jgi:hypothetical protein